jgi:hypothetical protein
VSLVLTIIATKYAVAPQSRREMLVEVQLIQAAGGLDVPRLCRFGLVNKHQARTTRLTFSECATSISPLSFWRYTIVVVTASPT